jgi:hypothetical protein
MRGGRVVLIVSLAAVCVVASIVIALVVADEGRASYTPDEVAAALRAQGLRVSVAQRSDGAAALLPRDGAFTVLVLESDRTAREAFTPYKGDADPETVELLAGNVIVLADASNSTTSLPQRIRAKLVRALDQLRDGGST